MSEQMKTLKRPLKVGEFLHYNQQTEGALGFIHKFLKEMHGDAYDEFVKREKEEQESKDATPEEIHQAEVEEAEEQVEIK